MDTTNKYSYSVKVDYISRKFLLYFTLLTDHQAADIVTNVRSEVPTETNVPTKLYKAEQ
jgi:hypothetical protein